MSDEDDNKGLAAWAAEGIEEPAAAIVVVPETPVAEAAALEDEPVVPVASADEEPAIEGDEPPVAAAAPKPVKSQAKPLEPWVKDRLGELTAEKREAQRQTQEAVARATAAEAELAALRRKAADGETPPAADAPRADTRPPADYVPASEVDKRAEQMAREKAFNAQADAAYFSGKESYTDFDNALQPLAEMGAINRRDFQEAALATEAAPDVIYYLGSNPNEASKILADLKAGNTAKATAAMTKIALKVGATKAATAKAARKVSDAPAPIRPVGGSAIPVTSLDKMNDDDFTVEIEKMAKVQGWY